MGMVKKLWSISALAVELDRDRRTIAKFLRGVPPDGQLDGNPAWYLQTALSALSNSNQTVGSDPLPTGFEVLDQVQNPFHQGVLTTLLGLVYSVGPTVAVQAVAAGAPMQAAFALHNLMILHFAGETEEFTRSIGIDPRANTTSGGIFTLGKLEPTNWKTLADMAGEPMDLRSWQTWFQERSKLFPDAMGEA